MAYTTVEIFAIIIALIIVFKMALLYLFPEFSRSCVKHFTKKKLWYNLYSYMAFILLVVLFYFLYLETSIFHILIGVSIGGLLFFLWMIAYPSKTKALFNDSIKDVHAGWFSYLLYLVLALWVLWLVLM